MKDLYFLNKKKIEYKSILNELTNIDTDLYTLDEAYIENGTVFIHGRFKTEVTDAKDYQVFPIKYRPRTLINGTLGCSWEMSDIYKIGYVRVGADGILGVWIDNLVGRERFNIQYPLKVE